MEIFKSLHLCEACQLKPATCEAHYFNAYQIEEVHHSSIIEDPGKVVLCNKFVNKKGMAGDIEKQ